MSTTKKFTGQPYNLNRNLGLKAPISNGYLYGNYSNASGPVPPEFNLDFYNALIADNNATLQQLNAALIDINGSLKEYQRQVDYHNGVPGISAHPGTKDLANVVIAKSWKDTVQQMYNETADKIKTKTDALPTGTGTGTGTGAGAGTGDNNIKPETNWVNIGLYVAGGLALATGLFFGIRYFVKSGKAKTS